MVKLEAICQRGSNARELAEKLLNQTMIALGSQEPAQIGDGFSPVRHCWTESSVHGGVLGAVCCELSQLRRGSFLLLVGRYESRLFAERDTALDVQ